MDKMQMEMDILLSELKRTRKFSFLISCLLFVLSLVLIKDSLNIYVFGFLAFVFSAFLHNFVFYVMAIIFAPSLRLYLESKKANPKKSLKDIVIEVFGPTQGTGSSDLDYHLEIYSDVIDGIQGTIFMIVAVLLVGVALFSAF